MDGYDLMNNGFNGGLYNQIDTAMSENSKKLNVTGDLCNWSSSVQESRDDQCQLHDFDGIEQMDEIFLNSILEDVLHTSVCSISPFSELRLQPDNELISADAGMDGSAYIDTLGAFLLSDGLDNSEVSLSRSAPCNSGRYHGMPIKGQPQFTILDPSEENGSEEASLEGFVLQDFQRAVEKMTDRTRICFRDTFYRLAKNTRQQSVSPGTNAEDFAMEDPCTDRCDEQGERTRLKRTPESESVTNTIDRAIANLTFKKMESNICEFPLPSIKSTIKTRNAEST